MSIIPNYIRVYLLPAICCVFASDLAKFSPLFFRYRWLSCSAGSPITLVAFLGTLCGSACEKILAFCLFIVSNIIRVFLVLLRSLLVTPVYPELPFPFLSAVMLSAISRRANLRLLVMHFAVFRP